MCSADDCGVAEQINQHAKCRNEYEYTAHIGKKLDNIVDMFDHRFARGAEAVVLMCEDWQTPIRYL